MARKATSKPDSGTAQSASTTGFEASELGVIGILENQSRTLAPLRDTLRPKLLCGEIVPALS